MEYWSERINAADQLTELNPVELAATVGAIDAPEMNLRQAFEEFQRLHPEKVREKNLRLKSSRTFNSRNYLPSSRRSAMKSMDQTMLGASGKASASGLSRFKRLRG
ncbi:hypothetical protein LPJGGPFB_04344 [Ensifer adhaerens]|uniref:hypothetical protein n=1 Tax=Ensifer adhaerens TaxID=106592 RepID=UPI001568DA8A|nr:hypothetical protein [Ensifer adhaerens]NRP21085.1 hypothetical protein [Ensifer adhaerens]